MISMLNSARAAIAAIALLFVPTSSSAVTTAFIDGVGGVWGNFTPNISTLKVTNGGADMNWGRPANGKQSGYQFNGLDGTGPHALGSSFGLGKFTHNNFVIFGAALKSATLAVTITGRLVDGLTSKAFSVTSIFDVIHDETLNYQKKCPYGDRPPCGDLISFMTNAAKSETIEFNGSIFLFEASGFLGGFLNGNSLFSDENRQNNAVMQGKLTSIYTPPPPPSPVPLPAAFPLMAGALGVIALVSRRRKT